MATVNSLRSHIFVHKRYGFSDGSVIALMSLGKLLNVGTCELRTYYQRYGNGSVISTVPDLVWVSE